MSRIVDDTAKLLKLDAHGVCLICAKWHGDMPWANPLLGEWLYESYIRNGKAPQIVEDFCIDVLTSRILVAWGKHGFTLSEGRKK